jgi:hypothetical protein
MRKKTQGILEQPLMVVLISALAILLILSLQESKKKALIDGKNLEQNQENIALREEKVAEIEKLYEQSKNDLYKEKILRNELIKNKQGEILIQIPETEFKQNTTEEAALDKTDNKLQNWNAWWQLLFKNLY